MFCKNPIVRFGSINLLALAALLVGTACYGADAAAPVAVGADSPAIRYSGRTEVIGGAVAFDASGARVLLRFEGPSVAARIKDDTGENYAVVWIDGKMKQKLRLDAKDGFYPLAEGLSAGEHTVEVVRVTECNMGLTRFESFLLPDGGRALPWKQAHERRIEFIGDSVTCAYGVEAASEKEHFTPGTENFCLGYASLTARALDADYLVVARSGIGIYRNYGASRDGSADTMPGVYPFSFYLNKEYVWDFSRFTPNVVCFNIGPNDYWALDVDEDRFVERFCALADLVAGHYPAAKLVITEGPMGNDNDPATVPLRKALDRVLAHLEKTAPGRASFAWLSPEGKLGFGADWHPSRAQSEVNAAELAQYLRGLMGW